MPRREIPPSRIPLQQGLCPVFLDYSVDLFNVYSGIMGDGRVARSDREAGESKDPYFRLLRSPDHNPSCLMSPAVGPLESALVASLICLASITQLLDAN